MNKQLNNNQDQQRVSILISGAVQGVGFRPFIFRLAQELGLTGFVHNNSSGVNIEAEGPSAQLVSFLDSIPANKPDRSIIQNYQYTFMDPKGYTAFEIKESEREELKTAVVLPDSATCPQCLNEIFMK